MLNKIIIILSVTVLALILQFAYNWYKGEQVLKQAASQIYAPAR